MVAGDVQSLLSAIADYCDAGERQEILRLAECGLPPVTSVNSLSVMTGFNPGFIWSMLNRPDKYYRVFEIPKGRKTREIEAPRVALKYIQKWLSLSFDRVWRAQSTVHGFVRERSHMSAAQTHVGAIWVASLDIENFFPSVSADRVESALEKLGYQSIESLLILVRILCYRGRLSQGAPSSPVVSNIVMDELDRKLQEIALHYGVRYTRYADDIVFSGTRDFDSTFFEKAKSLVVADGWSLSPRKVGVTFYPQRLKVHGLLVHGDAIRLTKGYRKKIRALKHLVDSNRVAPDKLNSVRGHLNFANQVERWR